MRKTSSCYFLLYSRVWIQQVARFLFFFLAVGLLCFVSLSFWWFGLWSCTVFEGPSRTELKIRGDVTLFDLGNDWKGGMAHTYTGTSTEPIGSRSSYLDGAGVNRGWVEPWVVVSVASFVSSSIESYRFGSPHTLWRTNSCENDCNSCYWDIACYD